MLTDVAGFRVGHWTDPVARTGCTVVCCPEGTVGAGAVAGGAPATREFALLDPTRLVQHVDAVVLSGGSAFGLSAADGVVQRLEAAGRGHPTSVGPVPIVVAASIFDLSVGDPSVRPGPEAGAAAYDAARSDRFDVGLVGAGCGATIAKWHGRDSARAGGLGTATMQRGELVVTALVVVNAVGSIDDGSTVADPGRPATATTADEAYGNTTLAIIATNARVDKVTCSVVARSGHDGMARALVPAHTQADGDAVVALATQQVDADPPSVAVLGQHAVTRAIRSLAAR